MHFFSSVCFNSYFSLYYKTLDVFILNVNAFPCISHFFWVNLSPDGSARHTPGYTDVSLTTPVSLGALFMHLLRAIRFRGELKIADFAFPLLTALYVPYRKNKKSEISKPSSVKTSKVTHSSYVRCIRYFSSTTSTFTACLSSSLRSSLCCFSSCTAFRSHLTFSWI